MSSVNYSLKHKGVKLIPSEKAWIKGKNGKQRLNSFYTFANMTLDKAMGIFLEENPGAEGVVLVHQNGVFSYLDRVEKLNKGVYNA